MKQNRWQNKSIIESSKKSKIWRRTKGRSSKLLGLWRLFAAVTLHAKEKAWRPPQRMGVGFMCGSKGSQRWCWGFAFNVREKERRKGKGEKERWKGCNSFWYLRKKSHLWSSSNLRGQGTLPHFIFTPFFSFRFLFFFFHLLLLFFDLFWTQFCPFPNGPIWFSVSLAVYLFLLFTVIIWSGEELNQDFTQLNNQDTNLCA